MLLAGFINNCNTICKKRTPKVKEGEEILDILAKKIILYGNKKIQEDFRILFNELDIVQDDKCNGIKDDPKEYFIVVCEKKPNNIFEKSARERRLKYRENYTYIEDFFKYFNPMFLERKNRKLAVWGTGVAASELWDVLDGKGIASEIDFYIDNKLDKKIFKGKAVVAPEEIRGRKDIYIIAATYRFQWEIYKQLNEYGFQHQKDYTHCTIVSRDYKPLLDKVCFSEEKYPFYCNRPFGYCDIIGEELYLCCPDFLNVSAGSMMFEPFMNCWNSYAARIIRLSIINGTFVFCNKQYCDLFDFERCDKSQLKSESDKKDTYVQSPNTLMVGIDYSCNLQCPSCRKECCVAAADERAEMNRQAEDLLEHVIPNVNRLWMAGNGEVFFSPVYRKILNDERCKKRTGISILSNGTLFNEKEWKSLEETYQSIEIVVSMDGIRDETIERLRKGSNAQNLKKNLEFLGKLRKAEKIHKLFVSCVLQADNVAELYELLDYCKEIGADKVQFLKLKDNGTYIDKDCFDRVSVFDKNDCLKKEYKHYFTKDLLTHPLADWFNSTETLGVEKRPRLDKYDTL